MIRAVVDTNLIVSSTTSPRGTPHDLLETWHRKRFELVLSPQLLDEIKDVMNRPKIRELGITQEDINDLLLTLSTNAYLTQGSVSVDIIKNDPDDNVLIATAIEGLATHIVTGDKKHLLPLEEHQGIKIVTARHFLDTCLK